MRSSGSIHTSGHLKERPGSTSDSGHLNNIVLVKFSGAGDLIWSRVGGPGFGTGRDVAVSPDGTAVFVSGNILADDPNFFGGFAFVAEFTAAGKAKKANLWGSSPEFSASAESLVVSGDGLVVTAGFVGPGPHEFSRASNSAKNAATQILPFDSTSLGGDDAFTLWTQR